MRTVIAPLHPEVQQELRALDRRRAQIARRYIRRLALEPYLGARVERGLLAEYGCRRIHFDRHDRPDDLFGAGVRRSAAATRTSAKAPAGGSCTGCARRHSHRSGWLSILAVAPATRRPPDLNAYELAGRRLEALIGTRERKEGRGERVSHQRGGVPSDHVR